MDRNDLRVAAGLLLYGGPGSVDRIARELVERRDWRIWAVLVETIRSQEDLSVRIRCLQVLAASASLGDEATAGAVLAALGRPHFEGEG